MIVYILVCVFGDKFEMSFRHLIQSRLTPCFNKNPQMDGNPGAGGEREQIVFINFGKEVDLEIDRGRKRRKVTQ